MTVGFGHGIAVTPLHLALGYAALFNGGIWRPATLLKIGPGHAVPEGHRVFSEETSYRMRALLRLVVIDGTGRKADAPGYRIGGKTGTAEKVVGGRYTSTPVVTTFAGVFPMDEPRYVIVCMLDDPKALPETFGFHTAGVERRAGGVAGGQPGRRLCSASMPDLSRDVNMAEVLPYIHREEKH